ncbi:hypothetical protein V8E52_007529 [Russula decolorans]
MPIAKEAGTSDDSARRPLDRHLRYNAHKYTRLRLATDWGGVVTNGIGHKKGSIRELHVVHFMIRAGQGKVVIGTGDKNNRWTWACLPGAVITSAKRIKNAIRNKDECIRISPSFADVLESERGSGGATSGGRFTNSQEDRRAQKGDTVGTVQLMHREVRLSPTLAGTMMIDGERAPLSTGPGSAAVSDFSTLRGTSALHVEVPQYLGVPFPSFLLPTSI